jgi:hypothetical protein
VIELRRESFFIRTLAFAFVPTTLHSNTGGGIRHPHFSSVVIKMIVPLLRPSYTEGGGCAHISSLLVTPGK